MKLFIIFVCVAGITSGSILKKNVDSLLHKFQNPHFDIDLETIKNLLEDLIAKLKPLDPFHEQSKSVTLLGYKFDLTNVDVEGFSNILQDISIDSNITTKTLKVDVGLSAVSGSIESWALSTPVLFGNGDASSSIKNAKISIEISYRSSKGFEPSKVLTSMGEATVSISGVNNSDKLSKKISNFLTSILNDVFNYPQFHAIIGRAIDSFLSGII
ncbi:hypothetical protein RI129_004318 [Pyrocoelia pectoralis]|uniref:Uncharacterized protein n=1 Tax=Pyrocoelia pectoralis TaxID=417401 RepID=A0AAN7VKT7_9COLE